MSRFEETITFSLYNYYVIKYAILITINSENKIYETKTFYYMYIPGLLKRSQRHTFPPLRGTAVWKADSTANVPLPCIGTAVNSVLETPEDFNKYRKSGYELNLF